MWAPVRPSLERVRELLAYDPETGDLMWRAGSGRGATPAGWVHPRGGHRYVTIRRQHIPARYVAWLLQTGAWPEREVFCANRDQTDLRWVNLRRAPPSRDALPGSPPRGVNPESITAEDAREFFSYDPATGELRWRRAPAPNRPRLAGQIVGHIHQNGYHRLTWRLHVFLAHRIIWLLQTGTWPTLSIDHINGDRSDNRWSNLRLATAAQNCQNRKISSRNKTGVTGVHQLKTGKWKAHIAINNRFMYLGQFDTKEEAAITRRAAELLFQKDFARSRSR